MEREEEHCRGKWLKTNLEDDCDAAPLQTETQALRVYLFYLAFPAVNIHNAEHVVEEIQGQCHEKPFIEKGS